MLGMIISSVIEVTLILLIIYGYVHEKEFITYKKRLWRKFKLWLSAKLRSSRRFMKWLYEPTISQQIEADYKQRPVRTWEYK